MSSYQELVSVLKEILTNRFYPKPEFIKGLLGDGLGNVVVPGRPDYNYVRFNRSASETFEVFNKEVSQPVDGTPVLIGTYPWQPGLVQVVGIDWESYLQTSWGNNYASIQAHAPTHEWPDFIPGSDYMRVFARAIYPLQGYGGGTGSMSFTAYPYQYDYTGTNSYWPGTPAVSLGPTRPPTGTMRYMGVYLNPATNQLGVVTGASVTFVADGEPPYPAWPLNVYPVAYARVYGGQAYFVERDIKDARRLWNTTLIYTGTSGGGGGAPSGPAGGDLTGTYPDPRVVSLNTIPIIGAPTNNQFLMFTGSAWRPTTQAASGGGTAASQATVDAGTNTTEFVNPSTLANTTLIERAYQNLAYNGSMAIWQRGTSFAAVADGQYTADGWKYRLTAGVMAHTISQSSDVPTAAQAGILAPYSLLVDCTTIDASIAAGDLVTIGTRVEGFDFAKIAQRGFGCSFWVKATKIGIYCISFRNSAADRSYVAEFTVNVTATWEYKTVLVSASPSAGTWDYTTGIGLSIEICLAGGSNFNTTAGAWQTGSFLNTSNQVNGVDSTANDFRIALFDIFPGSWDRPFPVEDYQKRLNRCLRYAYVLDASSNAVNTGQGAKVVTTNINIMLPLPVRMRIAPSLSHNISAYAGGTPGTTTIVLINYATNGFFVITGALTVALANANSAFASIGFTAGTSWSDTAGDLATLRLGPGVVACLSAEL